MNKNISKIASLTPKCSQKLLIYPQRKLCLQLITDSLVLRVATDQLKYIVKWGHAWKCRSRDPRIVTLTRPLGPGGRVLSGGLAMSCLSQHGPESDPEDVRLCTTSLMSCQANV